MTPRASRSPTPEFANPGTGRSPRRPGPTPPAISVLPGVLAEPAFVFAEKQGYRFTGRSIGSDSGAVEITLERSDGPPAPAMRMLPPALTRDQEKKLLHVIFDPYAEQVLKQEQSPDRYRVAQDPRRSSTRCIPVSALNAEAAAAKGSNPGYLPRRAGRGGLQAESRRVARHDRGHSRP